MPFVNLVAGGVTVTSNNRLQVGVADKDRQVSVSRPKIRFRVREKRAGSPGCRGQGPAQLPALLELLLASSMIAAQRHSRDIPCPKAVYSARYSEEKSVDKKQASQSAEANSHQDTAATCQNRGTQMRVEPSGSRHIG